MLSRNEARVASHGRALRGRLLLMIALAVPALLQGGHDRARADADEVYDVVRAATLQPDAALPMPTGPVLLTVHGAMRHAGGGGPVRLDRRTLERLGTVRYTSRNPWYDDPVTYEGVLAQRLLDLVGVPAGATHLRVRALNDYEFRIPLMDFAQWPVLLALKVDGAYLSPRDKGPIWIVYPNHIHPELADESHRGKWVWQVTEMVIE